MAVYWQSLPGLRMSGPLADVQIGLPDPLLSQAIAAGKPPPSVPLRALIDTGASNTCVQAGTGKALGLNPVGSVPMTTASHANVVCPLYYVRLTFPGGLWGDFTVAELPLQNQGLGCLIGRDVLAHGILIYNGAAEHYSFAF